MREMIQMVIVVTVLSLVSGGLLAFAQKSTQLQIENNKLTFVKGPAIKAIMEGAGNDPIADRFNLTVGDAEKSVFVGVFDGQPAAIAVETYGKGFGGDVGVMVGIDVKNDALLGIGVTTHAETPGMGAKAKSDPTFAAQFKGMPITNAFQVQSDGGQVNAISGATITSRAVCVAANEAVKLYNDVKPQITEKMKTFAK